MTGALYGLARFCVRRRLLVVGVWLVVAVALVAVSHQLGDNTNDNLSLPGTDSQMATDVLKKSFPDQANGTSPIVLHAHSGQLTDSKYANAVNEAAADVAKAPNVASVVNPLTSQGANALSKDKATGYLSVTLSKSPGSLSVGAGPDDHRCRGEARRGGGAAGGDRRPARPEGVQAVDRVQRAHRDHRRDGDPDVHVRDGRRRCCCRSSRRSSRWPRRWRSSACSATSSRFPTVAPTLATMIGLGVGIDYALFIVTRHFRGLRDGLPMDESIARATATSGGAVFFAGGTVTIALVSLLVAGIPLVTTMGLMAAIAVVLAVLGALTLLPAVLAILGPRINALRVREIHPEGQSKHGFSARWAHSVANNPLIAGLAALGDPDPADDPAALADARTAGRRARSRPRPPRAAPTT